MPAAENTAPLLLVGGPPRSGKTFAAACLAAAGAWPVDTDHLRAALNAVPGHPGSYAARAEHATTTAALADVVAALAGALPRTRPAVVAGEAVTPALAERLAAAGPVRAVFFRVDDIDAQLAGIRGAAVVGDWTSGFDDVALVRMLASWAARGEEEDQATPGWPTVSCDGDLVEAAAAALRLLCGWEPDRAWLAASAARWSAGQALTPAPAPLQWPPAPAHL